MKKRIQKPPKPLKEGEVAKYAANPYFDDILVFPTLQIPTSQDYYLLIDKENDLYKRKEKGNVTEFHRRVKDMLNKKKKPWWPFDEQIAVVVSVTGPKAYIEFKDVDNFLKTVFDAIKGIVVRDDHLIVNAEVNKYEVPFISGLIIAIRKMNPLDEYTYGQDAANWEKDRQLKLSRGGICCIDDYM